MQVDYYCLLEQEKVWRDINELALACGSYGGTYRVHAHKPGAALCWHPYNMMRIGRATGEDPLGLLYVGAAEDFRVDFISLWASLGPVRADVAEHPVGKAFSASEALRRRFRLLCFTLRFSADPAATQAEELAAYTAEYGELPPLHQLAVRQREALAAIA
ncbi:hypothetical protein [Falsiroseomonas sp.]|uniref:hypothetical protein n=1 Tax=Falsiroseomonas sp. TaxID=2870721 RepID=UPI00356978DD